MPAGSNRRSRKVARNPRGPFPVIRLSIPVRQALAKLTLPLLIAAAFGLMLLGKADALLAERARMALADALAPIFGVLAEPLPTVRAVGR